MNLLHQCVCGLDLTCGEECDCGRADHCYRTPQDRREWDWWYQRGYVK